MHSIKFNASTATTYQDFDTPEEAIAQVESIGAGTVVKFVGSANMPHCLPEIVYRSCAMWSYQNGEWWSHYIFSGTGEKLEKEKPHN